MPPNTVQIQIIPESDTIHLFRDETTTMNETYDLRGHIRLIPIIYKKDKKNYNVNHKKQSYKPISVQQIHLHLKGHVQTMLTSDFSDSDRMGDYRWCKDTTTLPLLDRILYSARGYANVTECVLDQQLTITPGILSLTEVTDVPFRFPIENTQHLPPSITSPKHLISYYITATVQEDIVFSLPTTSDVSLPTPSTSSSSSSSSSQVPSSSSKKYRSQLFSKKWPFFKVLKKKSSSSVPLSTSMLSLKSSASFASFSTPAPPTVRLPLTIECHHLGSLYALTHQPRIRYCGARPNALRYQIHLAKYIRFQGISKPTEFSFQCSFFPLSPLIRLSKLVCYLVQYETFPIKAGQVQSSTEPLPTNQVEVKPRKVGYKEHIISEDDDLERLSISISLNNPQLVPPVNTTSLIITHKLRLAVYFEGKEKKMTLSFPIVFCSIPPSSPAPVQPTQIPMSSLHSSMTMMLYHGDTNTTPHDFVTECKLPSYLDAMFEGTPPSPFLEDQITAI
ncbi:uncharacterized protein BX664DRAFT_336624 [Halteromyces radiatus]|uniref:uncharacterized protein n=1 Tax=Halteromyces radiatus TaxID=101107 RepID=UPI00221F6050|nr:uncharacterized protein BX664DRAFT_336624 [Halteromyces radiatus]KAI8086728.1 hypothetical protein BX664DRAFT_336624 [Halteromyces radiatus]